MFRECLLKSVGLECCKLEGICFVLNHKQKVRTDIRANVLQGLGPKEGINRNHSYDTYFVEGIFQTFEKRRVASVIIPAPDRCEAL